MAQAAKSPQVKGQTDHLGRLQIHKSGSIYAHSYVQTNKHKNNWILLDTCSSIDLFVIDPMCAMCTKQTLHYPSQQMQER